MMVSRRDWRLWGAYGAIIFVGAVAISGLTDSPMPQSWFTGALAGFFWGAVLAWFWNRLDRRKQS